MVNLYYIAFIGIFENIGKGHENSLRIHEFAMYTKNTQTITLLLQF